MSKNKFHGHAPRATKGELVKAAKEQTKAEDKVVGLNDAPPAVLDQIDKAVAEQPKGQEASTVSTAPSTPQAEEKPAPAAPAKPKKTGMFVLGKKYVPKTDRNSVTWGKLTKALASGPRTMKDLTEEIKDHKDFLGYMTRGGHIVPYVEEATK